MCHGPMTIMHSDPELAEKAMQTAHADQVAAEAAFAASQDRGHGEAQAGRCLVFQIAVVTVFSRVPVGQPSGMCLRMKPTTVVALR